MDCFEAFISVSDIDEWEKKKKGSFTLAAGLELYATLFLPLLELLLPQANALEHAWSQVGLCVGLSLGSGIRKRQNQRKEVKYVYRRVVVVNSIFFFFQPAK